MVVTMFGSSVQPAGVGAITTVDPSSTTTNDMTCVSSVNASTVGQAINSPVGAPPGTVSVGAVSGGTSGSGGGGNGAGGSASSGQNATAASASVTPSATAAASTAPAHAPTGVDPVLLTEMRLYFCVFVRDLIRHLPRERRQRLLPPSVRRNLVLLIARWSGFYEHIFNARDVKWAQPPWVDHSSSQWTQSNKYASQLPSLAASLPPPPGIDQVISGDLVLSISGIHLESAPQDPFISASFLDTSIWLELLWYANQSIAALVCCGNIFEHLAIFTNPRIADASESSLIPSSHQLSGLSVGPLGGNAPSNLPPNPTTSAVLSGLSTNALPNEEDAISTPNSSQVLNTVPLASPTVTRVVRGQPIPGYIFHWLKGLLLCRDAKLSISPWLWGLPVVNFGVCSTALKGPHGKTGVRNIKLEDSLRSIVIAAAAGRRLDSVSLSREDLIKHLLECTFLSIDCRTPSFSDNLGRKPSASSWI